MPLVRPLRGLGYALDRFGAAAVPERVALPDEPPTDPGRRLADLTDLACPPYDVISAELQRDLLARHERNAVRLELSAEPDPHAAAAATLAAWRSDGTLERRADPSLYAYAHATPDNPDAPTVRGVLARVLLEPYGGEVRAHEHTLPGPKADRLALLRATRTQLSPILAVYFDRSARERDANRGGTDEWRARDEDGLLHALAALEPDEPLADELSRQRLYIADGHHRYETALAYQAEVRADPARAAAPPGSLGADWIAMVLVNAEREELAILPTHRLLRRGADAEALRAVVRDADPLWQAVPLAPADIPARLAELRDADEPVFGLVLPGNEGWLLVGDASGIADRMRRERASSAVRRLDMAVLHAALLDDRLGIDGPALAAGERLAYTRSEADAADRVARGEAAAAILVRPTRLEQLAAVASAGEVMPQKSTYFYPKLLTGLAFSPLEDG